MTRRCSAAAAVLVMAILAGCSSDEPDSGNKHPTRIEIHGGSELVYQIYTNEARLEQLRNDKAELERRLKTLSGDEKTKLAARIKEIADEIDALNVGAPDDLAQRMIEILKRRVDPTGGSGIEFRPMGKDRFAVRMPAARADSRKARDKHAEALARLDARNLRPGQINSAAVLPVGPERDKAIAALGGGDRALSTDLTLLCEAHDRIARAGDPDARREARVRWDKKLRDFKDKHTLRSAEMQAVLRRYAAARAAKGNKKQARPRMKEYEDALAHLLRRYPARGKEIDAVVESYKDWLNVRQFLDDPEDLKRLIARAGQLEFRIAVTVPGSRQEVLPITQEAYASYVETLRREGPEGAASQNDPLRWFPIHGKQDDYPGMVVSEYAGQYYILLQHTRTQYTMLHKRWGSDWSLKRSYPTTDSYNSPAVGFTFDERGAKRFARLTGDNVGRHLAVLLDDTVYSCPVIRQAISDSGIISGSFSRAEVMEMVRVLEAGSLPARLNPVPISETYFKPVRGKTGGK